MPTVTVTAIRRGPRGRVRTPLPGRCRRCFRLLRLLRFSGLLRCWWGLRSSGHARLTALPFSAVPSAPEGTWPDPAAVLLTALGPGPRLWERHDGHPEALVVRLGTTDRADVPSVPVTVGLREAGSLGLAGPRARLAGLARATVAQLAALHSPSTWRSCSSPRTAPAPWRSGGASGPGWGGCRICARCTGRTAGSSSRTTVSRRTPGRPSWSAASTRARSAPAGRTWTAPRWPTPPARTRARTRWSCWTATPVRRRCARRRPGWPVRGLRPASI